MMNRAETKCQPCDNFMEREESENPHGCPECGGLRYFCENCHRDHHEGGWNTCTLTECRYDHPICLAKRIKMGEKKLVKCKDWHAWGIRNKKTGMWKLDGYNNWHPAIYQFERDAKMCCGPEEYHVRVKFVDIDQPQNEIQ